ncbi:hypothetical protein PCANB_001912 [Pneumocystis canis]|nr:hypothetical protein PCANB_001912 [Pneumocystis canis]
MRYADFDCLIFPLNRHVPIPEFRTSFCLTHDPDHITALNNKNKTLNNSGSCETTTIDSNINLFNTYTTLTLPTVTTYISCLPPTDPIKISLHSWTPPHISRAMASMPPKPEENVAYIPMFEARIYIDGIPITYQLMLPHSKWPVVIDSYNDHNNTSHRIYFPSHKLENISSLTGYAVPPDFSSIKMILSEGWLQTRENARPLFKRVRNIVCFMFQYAEPELLEASGISYPSFRPVNNYMLSCFSFNSYVDFQPNDIPLPLSNDNSPHSSLSDNILQMTNTLDDPTEDVTQLNTLSASPFDLNKSQFNIPLNTQEFSGSFSETPVSIIQEDSALPYNLYSSFIQPSQKDLVLDTKLEIDKENVSAIHKSPRKTTIVRNSLVTKSPSRLKKDSKVTKRSELLKEIQKKGKPKLSNDVDKGSIREIEALLSAVPELEEQYHVLKLIGYGTFSCVFKAIDMKYHEYDNSPWENGLDTLRYCTRLAVQRTHYVAIKQIYATQSTHRVVKELKILEQLKPSVTCAITAFRHQDQVLIVLPYIMHADFREFYLSYTLTDVSIYIRELFRALSSVHELSIIHRDIKPANFCWNPFSKKGSLVDFGLAQWEKEFDTSCACSKEYFANNPDFFDKENIKSFMLLEPDNAYIKKDLRHVDSNRIFLMNTGQTKGVKEVELEDLGHLKFFFGIDVWSAGIILLVFLIKRFPFFQSDNDINALVELAHIFGRTEMKKCARLHDCSFDDNIPSISDSRISWWQLIKIFSINDSYSIFDGEDESSVNFALDFLEKCLTLNPSQRIQSKTALEHPFLNLI